MNEVIQMFIILTLYLLILFFNRVGSRQAPHWSAVGVFASVWLASLQQGFLQVISITAALLWTAILCRELHLGPDEG